MILEITLGFFVIITITLSYAVYNLLIKQEQLEDWVEDYIAKINEVNTKIRQIDYKGYFEVKKFTNKFGPLPESFTTASVVLLS